MARAGESTVTRSGAAEMPKERVRARLHVVYPPELSVTLSLGAEKAVLGRRPEDETLPRINHPTVSRSHFAVEWDATQKQHFGTDLGSHNGSWVNGVAVGMRRLGLKDGTILRLGDVLLVYESGRALSAVDAREVDKESIPGEASSTFLLRAAISRAAPDPSPVLLVGETGTGKERIAGEVHRLSGRDGPLLATNCAALNPQIIDSQLFGHVRGAFTGATENQQGLFRAAHGGTLFLDEIGELPLDLQPKLLRVIQEAEVVPVGSPRGVKVDVRVVAATNRDLPIQVEQGLFRRDLYARLSLWEIRVPPIRERRVDVLTWIDKLHRLWVEKRSGSNPKPLQFAVAAAEALLLHAWPDNLRGMDRLIHELAASGVSDVQITLNDLPEWMSRRSGEPNLSAETPVAPRGSSLPSAKLPLPSREDFEAVLRGTGGNVRAMAKHFGRDRRQIYRWLEAFDLTALRNELAGAHEKDEGKDAE
jgi:transcriptional regulator with PAS, ATPase and Fis domain